MKPEIPFFISVDDRGYLKYHLQTMREMFSVTLFGVAQPGLIALEKEVYPAVFVHWRNAPGEMELLTSIKHDQYDRVSLEVIKRIRGIPDYQQTPILVTRTSSVSERDYLKAGATSTLDLLTTEKIEDFTDWIKRHMPK